MYFDVQLPTYLFMLPRKAAQMTWVYTFSNSTVSTLFPICCHGRTVSRIILKCLQIPTAAFATASKSDETVSTDFKLTGVPE